MSNSTPNERTVAASVREDHADIEETMPSEAIQNASDARRKLENYWAKRDLDAQLRALDDWDDDSMSANG